jgi:hypothetical protein
MIFYFIPLFTYIAIITLINLYKYSRISTFSWGKFLVIVLTAPVASIFFPDLISDLNESNRQLKIAQKKIEKLRRIAYARSEAKKS